MGSTSALVQLYFSPTSALLQLYFSPTSALLRPYVSSASALLQLYFSPTSALLQAYVNPTSASCAANINDSFRRLKEAFYFVVCCVFLFIVFWTPTHAVHLLNNSSCLPLPSFIKCGLMCSTREGKQRMQRQPRRLTTLFAYQLRPPLPPPPLPPPSLPPLPPPLPPRLPPPPLPLWERRRGPTAVSQSATTWPRRLHREHTSGPRSGFDCFDCWLRTVSTALTYVGIDELASTAGIELPHGNKPGVDNPDLSHGSKPGAPWLRPSARK